VFVVFKTGPDERTALLKSFFWNNSIKFRFNRHLLQNTKFIFQLVWPISIYGNIMRREPA
jgi:hypothetical protein